MKNTLKYSRTILISIFTLIAAGITQPLLACELCESRQPAMWRGVTHGPGPEGNLDHIITWSAIVIVGITLYLSIKLLVRPGENQKGHIKNIVIEDQSV